MSEQTRASAPRSRRISIGWLMVFVAVVAIEFGAIRAAFPRSKARGYAPPVNSRNKLEFWARGGLPMANLLAIGLLAGWRRRVGRTWLVGFELAGFAALAAYVFAVHHECERRYLRWSDVVPSDLLGNHVVAQVCASTILVMPQVVIALIGGWLARWAHPPARASAAGD
ncbi:hypothetical protein TA3x_001272 [Tundrisphaera sp. TA3]|uniref:hypothetical protein n=1 Tax=Tundrisphaera sp. TA3 TaxID=3435775 RepID=UPI003EBD95E7